MADEKPHGAIDDIISSYERFRDKKFEDRIKKFEESHSRKKNHTLKIQQHADYVVMGHPTNKKQYPGAYNDAYSVLDKMVSGDDEKLKDKKQWLQILEKYVDTFLQTHFKLGKEEWKELLDEFKNQKLSDEEIREQKGQFFARYFTDEEGRGINILSDEFLKQYEGKTKVELIKFLKEISQRTIESYSTHLINKMHEPLIKEQDRVKLAKYIAPILEKAGYKHPTKHILKHARQLAAEYSTFLNAGDLARLGYERVLEEKPKKDKK